MAEQTGQRITLTVDELKDLIQSKSEVQGLSAKSLAAAVAEGAAKARKLENPESPGISVFSYPEGELARPKPELKCPMFIGGAPFERSTLTPKEIEALNKMEPGHYRVLRADQDENDPNRTVVEVRGRRNSNQQLDQLMIVINKEDPNKNHFGTLTRLVSQFTDANRVHA